MGGHDHDCDRTHPVRARRKASSNGVVYVVARGFYAPGYPGGRDWFTATSTHGDVGNYATIDVAGKALRAAVRSGGGTLVIDEFTLSR